MKNLILLFLAVSVLLSCSKTSDLKDCGCKPPVRKLTDYSYKYLFDTNWGDYNTTEDTLRNDTLFIHSFKKDQELILKIPYQRNTEPTNYAVKRFTALYIRHKTDLSPLLYFTVDSTANNSAKFSIGANAISGNFNLTFKLANPSGNNAIDTIRAYFPSAYLITNFEKH